MPGTAHDVAGAELREAVVWREGGEDLDFAEDGVDGGVGDCGFGIIIGG